MELTDEQVKQIENQLKKTSKFELIELHNNFFRARWSKKQVIDEIIENWTVDDECWFYDNYFKEEK